MAFRLPRLPRSIAISESDGRPTRQFQQWFQSLVETIETQEASQDALLAAILAAQEAAATAQEAAASATAAVAEVNTAVETVTTTLVTVNTALTDIDTRLTNLETP